MTDSPLSSKTTPRRTVTAPLHSLASCKQIMTFTFYHNTIWMEKLQMMTLYELI